MGLSSDDKLLLLLSMTVRGMRKAHTSDQSRIDFKISMKKLLLVIRFCFFRTVMWAGV